MESQEVTETAKPKKPRKAPAPKPARTVEELVARALKLAATNPDAKWSAKNDKALFNSNEQNTEAAMKLCLDADRPLLTQSGTGGALTAAGFESVAADMPADDVGTLAKNIAVRLPLAEREAFISGVIGRSGNAAPELTELLAEAVSAAKAEAEAKVIADAKWKKANDEAQAALARAKALLEESVRNRRDALRRQYEALGGDPDDLPEPQPRQARPEKPGASAAPEARTDDEKDFRRYEADRLAAAWRDAWDAGKHEGRDYLETAMWNIRGLRMIGEADAAAKFDPRSHEADASLSVGAAVRVVRPGWLLKVDDEDYVALKATVQPI